MDFRFLIDRGDPFERIASCFTTSFVTNSWMYDRSNLEGYFTIRRVRLVVAPSTVRP